MFALTVTNGLVAFGEELARRACTPRRVQARAPGIAGEAPVAEIAQCG